MSELPDGALNMEALVAYALKEAGVLDDEQAQRFSAAFARGLEHNTAIDSAIRKARWDAWHEAQRSRRPSWFRRRKGA